MKPTLNPHNHDRDPDRDRDQAMTELKEAVLSPPEGEEEQEVEAEEGKEAEDGGGIVQMRVRLRMTPALNNLERVVRVTGLALHNPHDYNVNVMSWDNVDRLKLPAHTRYVCGWCVCIC